MIAKLPEALDKFQTPSAGRWVLQHTFQIGCAKTTKRFKPHQGGGGCCSFGLSFPLIVTYTQFQTPSAGRWVLQLGVGPHWFEDYELEFSNPISGEVGAAAL